MSIMEVLIKNVELWSIDRSLNTACPLKQYDKLIEEYGELVKGLNKNNKQLIMDSIGDMFIVMTIMMQQINGNIKLAEEISKFYEGESTTVNYIKHLSNLGGMLTKLLNDNAENTYLFTNIQTEISNLLSLLHKTVTEYKTSLFYCVKLAYDEIKNRKGKIIDGKFIKEDDLDILN